MSPRRWNRVLVTLATCAIAAGGPAWAGCGDDEENDARQAADEAAEEGEKALEEAGEEGEKAEKELDKALRDSGY
jgi:hypothetical protein